MKYSPFFKGIFALGGVALMAAGCPSFIPPIGVQPQASVGAKEGFGKLPSLSPLAEATRDMAISARPSAAPMPPAAKDPAMGMMTAPSGNVAMPTTPMVVRPIPYPQPKPVTVEYLLDGTLPTWSGDGDVLRTVPLQTDPSMVMAFGSKLGLPAAILNGVTQLSSFNAQWQDAEQIQWSLDSGSSAVNFWKNVPYEQPNWKIFPTFQKEEIVTAAKAFLEAHGFSSLAAQTPDIQEWPMILPMMGKPMQANGAGMPCPYIEGDVMMKGTAPSAAVRNDATVELAVPPQKIGTSMIYPCGGWWPMQVTLVYPAMREGKKVTDAYGNPAQLATITVALETKQVTNGYIQLDERLERSSYPLIDMETAKRRLQSGGRNPVWAYGEKNITVHLKTLELVWMRYDSWKEASHETYHLPALLATGTVDRGVKGETPEEYRTVVPLLKDDVFSADDGAVPPPMPMIPMPNVKY